MFHRLFRGHWFTPKLIGADQRVRWSRLTNEPFATYAQVYGCEICFLQNPERYYYDLHNRGICIKTLMGYTCHGRPGECNHE